MNKKPLHEQFREYVNPLMIPDGHCASCAFNTYLLLMGYIKSEEAAAFDTGASSSKKFGDWFYQKFMLDEDKNLTLSLDITNEKNQTFRDYEELVKNEILNKTNPGEAIIICVDYGTHWYNAYHTPENDVIFIDAQSGIQFNTYSSILRENTTITIMIPKKEIIKEYLEDVLPKIKEIVHKEYEDAKIKSGGKTRRKQKRRKTNKKNNKMKKTKKTYISL